MTLPMQLLAQPMHRCKQASAMVHAVCVGFQGVQQAVPLDQLTLVSFT